MPENDAINGKYSKEIRTITDKWYTLAIYWAKLVVNVSL